MEPVLSISKVQNTSPGQNMDLSIESLSPMECDLNVGDKKIISTTKHYNTKWKRRARTTHYQSQNTAKQTVGPKKRNNSNLT